MTKKTTGERMAIIETKVDSIEKTVNKIDCKLDELPKIYATKHELKDVERNLIERNNRQDNKNDTKWTWIAKNWFQIIQFIGILVIGIIALKRGI